MGAILPPPASRLPASIRPVEYAVAVDRYLSEARLSGSSRRVYKISLTSWCWPLVGHRLPAGRRRRGAIPPVVPLALLDDRAARARLAIAVADRSGQADFRTLSRELSALRGAIGWWQDMGWISTDPTAGLRHPGRAAEPPHALGPEQLAALWQSDAGLREHAFWRTLYDSAAPAPAKTSDLLGWLLAGRSLGPVFLTGRRAPGRAGPADVCPLTGRARLSYRRAAEIFTAHTSALDPAGRGWTLHQLRSAPRRTK